MAKAKPTKDYQALKIELDKVMQNLQREDIGVDEAVKLYEAAQEMIVDIKQHLKTAENKVTEIKSKYKDS